MLERGLQVALALEVVAKQQVGLEILRLGAEDRLEKIGRLVRLPILKARRTQGGVRGKKRRRDLEDPPILGFTLLSLVPGQMRARQCVTDANVAGITIERAPELVDPRGKQRVVQLLAGQRGELDPDLLRVRHEIECPLI